MSRDSPASGGDDKTLASRCSPARSPSTENQTLITGERSGSRRPVRHRRLRSTQHIAALSARCARRIRRSSTARRSSSTRRDGAGVYAFSRVDRDEQGRVRRRAQQRRDRLRRSTSRRSPPGATYTARVRRRGAGDDGCREPRHPSPCPLCRPSCGRPTETVAAPGRRPTSRVSVAEPGAGLTGSAARVGRRPIDALARDELLVAGRRLRRRGRRSARPRTPTRASSTTPGVSRAGRSSSTAPCRRMPPASARRHRPTPRSATPCEPRAEPEVPEEPSRVRRRQHPRQPQLRDGLRRRLGSRLRPGADDSCVDGIWRLHVVDLAGRPLRVQGGHRRVVGRQLRRERCAGRRQHRRSPTRAAKITFYFDPRTKIVQSTARGSDRDASRLVARASSGAQATGRRTAFASLMFDGDRDGVLRVLDESIPDRRLRDEGRPRPVAGTRTTAWAVRPGARNYSFSAIDGKLIVFRYTLATHVLEIELTDPPLPGTGQLAGALDRRRDHRLAVRSRCTATDATWQLLLVGRRSPRGRRRRRRRR